MLKAYNQDYAYTKHWETKYNKEKAYKIVRKLAKHFKLKNLNKVFFTCYSRGKASYSGNILLPKKDITLATICHELGHLLAYSKGIKGHTKKAYKYIHRIYRYGIRYIPTKILLGYNNSQLLLEKF